MRLHDYDEDKVADLISSMPLTKWSGSSKGQISYEDGVFTIETLQDADRANLEILYEWTKDICLYRLHHHFEKKA